MSRVLRSMKKSGILFLCMMLLASTVLSACGSTTEVKQETETAQPAETTEAAVETVTETEAETETINPYNEDGTRRAWISSEGNVNVRAKASTKGEYLGTFKPRQEIKLLSEEPKKGFYNVSGTDQVSGNEIEGYTSVDFISLDPPENPKVMLDVVSYLQTDERWEKILLGNTKLTMKDKGCATTSLAMSESFLKKQEITPDYIEANSIYTAEGMIGWPDDYYWYYTKEDSLQFMYNKLHEGIPVLVNYKRANGSQHWILVVGYKGDGEDLKAKDFVINDPLPFGRTTLQDFIDDFPYFSKLIYYCGDRATIKGSEEYNKAHKKSKKTSSKKSGKSSTSKKSSSKKNSN